MPDLGTQFLLYFFQKQPFRGVLLRTCSENIQQIYKRTPMPKRDLNKVVNLLLIFRTPFPKNTSAGLLLVLFMITKREYFKLFLNKLLFSCSKNEQENLRISLKIWFQTNKIIPNNYGKFLTLTQSLHKKWSFPLRIVSVIVTKSFFIFCAVKVQRELERIYERITIYNLKEDVENIKGA